MDYRILEIERLSAEDLRSVNTFTRMHVYVNVSISSDSRSANRTPVDSHGGRNPEWKNYRMKFTIDESLAQSNQISIVFQIMSRRIFGDRTIGFVYVPVCDLLDAEIKAQNGLFGGNCGGMGGEAVKRSACYQVTTPSGQAKGKFAFLYRLSEMFRVSAQPEEYNKYHHHLPSPYVGGHGYHSQAGLNYPYAPQGYQYVPTLPPPPPRQVFNTHNGLPPWEHNNNASSPEDKSKNKFGLGILLGAAAGCICSDDDICCAAW